MLFIAMLVAIRTRANAAPPKKSLDEPTELIRWSVQEIRRIVIRLAQRRIEPRHVIALGPAGDMPIKPPPDGHMSDQERNCSAS